MTSFSTQHVIQNFLWRFVSFSNFILHALCGIVSGINFRTWEMRKPQLCFCYLCRTRETCLIDCGRNDLISRFRRSDWRICVGFSRTPIHTYTENRLVSSLELHLMIYLVHLSIDWDDTVKNVPWYPRDFVTKLWVEPFISESSQHCSTGFISDILRVTQHPWPHTSSILLFNTIFARDTQLLTDFPKFVHLLGTFVEPLFIMIVLVVF